jgi:hypothetical protein
LYLQANEFQCMLGTNRYKTSVVDVLKVSVRCPKQEVSNLLQRAWSAPHVLRLTLDPKQFCL